MTSPQDHVVGSRRVVLSGADGVAGAAAAVTGAAQPVGNLRAIKRVSTPAGADR